MDPRLNLLDQLTLTRLDEDAEAGLLLTSLPVPPAAGARTLAGADSHTEPVGQWPDSPDPRRLLLYADAPAGAPNQVQLGQADPTFTNTPDASSVLFETCHEANWAWDRHYLRLRWQGRTIGLAMGMLVDGAPHWWEGCKLTVTGETPFCKTIEMGGVIPRDLFGADDVERWPGHENPYLHKHNWLNATIRTRLFANGVCQITAHHINSRYVDDGADLLNCVPIIGFRELPSQITPPLGPLVGDQTRWCFGDIQLDMTEVARLATPQEPGQLSRHGNFLIYQPYLGVSLYSGIFGRQRLGTPWLYEAKDQTIPRGMARTLRFSLSLNPKRSPRIARYLAPPYWYGLCQELTPHPHLTVSNQLDPLITTCREWTQQFIVKGGFEDGCLPRNSNSLDEETGRCETSWEGELPATMLYTAWQTSNATDYHTALRACHYYTDIAVDHSSKLVRMHGYSPPSVSLPMQRIHACIAAWLETGDRYHIDTAKSVIANAYILHKNSWPRAATGRDSCFIRGAVYLYRVLGETYYLGLARDAITDVIATQQPDGSFRDQGGGSGIHGWGAYITKPWMNCMVAGGMIDYLEVHPGDAQITTALRRLGDWFLSERWHHHGALGWSYKHLCKGRRRQYSPREGGELTLPTPDFWVSNYLARFLPFLTQITGDTAYGDAFLEAHENALRIGKRGAGGDHSAAQTQQYIPWLKSMLWQAKLTSKGITVSPLYLGDRTPDSATIQTPTGDIQAVWQEGEPRVPEGITVSPAKPQSNSRA